MIIFLISAFMVHEISKSQKQKHSIYLGGKFHHYYVVGSYHSLFLISRPHTIAAVSILKTVSHKRMTFGVYASKF